MRVYKRFITLLISLMVLVCHRSAKGGPADGTYLGVSALIEHGPSANKLTILFLGDGFTQAEQDVYNEKVRVATESLFNQHPFGAMHCAINVYRINIASAESGIDIPATCGTTSLDGSKTRRTPMDASYCASNTQLERYVFGSIPFVWQWAGMANVANVGGQNVFVYVLVNENKHGGGAQLNTRIAFGSIGNNFEHVFVHELGHIIATLEDEYDYGGPETHGIIEPGVNVTLNTNRNTIKWGNLILPNTVIPSQRCNDDDKYKEFDIVGLFEGGHYSKCGSFRPSSTCKMRVNTDAFCSVCRRQLILVLNPLMCTPLSVSFNDLLIRDDQDGSLGEIYFNYGFTIGNISQTGRWPGPEGEWDFDDGQTQSLNNFFAGVYPASSNAGIGIQMREYDWPDADDDVPEDAIQPLIVPGPFVVDKSAYKLTGTVRAASFKILLDMINIKDDNDGVSAGDIYIVYTISNGVESISGRWPKGDEEKSISTGYTENIGILAGVLPAPAPGNQLRLHVQVWDYDDFFSGADDLIGEDIFVLNSSSNFGANTVVHCQDKPTYRLTFSVAP